MRPGSIRLRDFAIAAPLACLSLALPLSSPRLGSVLFLGSSLVLLFVPRASAQSPSQDPQATTTPSAPTPQSEAEKKAAERKKRFEESKKTLEGKDPPVPQPKTQSPPPNPNSAAKPVSQPTAKIVFNIPVTMGVGETERFYLFDEQRGKVTAEAEWTVKDESSAADFSVVGGVPTVVGKGSGVVLLSAVLGDRSAVATITILPREKMNDFGPRFSYPSPQDHSSLKIIPSVPILGPRR